MSNKDRRDENGDSNCTGEVGSMRKCVCVCVCVCVYSMEDPDSAANVYKAKTLQINH